MRLGLAAKAHRAVMAAKRYQAHPVPEALRHLGQPYVPTRPRPAQRKPKRPALIAPTLPLGMNLIQAIVHHQLGICPACDDWLEFDPDFGISHPLRPSIDHVVPQSRGGQALANKLVMHRECNTLKGNRMPNGCELIWLAAVNVRLGL